MKGLRLAAMAGILGLATPALADGETAIFPVNGTNITAGEADAIGAVFAAAYEKASGKEILQPGDVFQVWRAAPTAKRAAEVLSVSEYVETSAVRLGTSIRVSCARYTGDGTLVSRTDMTAEDIDDFQDVAPRLAATLLKTTSSSRGSARHDHGHEHGHDRGQDRDRDYRDRRPARITQAEAGPDESTFQERVLGVKMQIISTLVDGATFDPRSPFSSMAVLRPKSTSSSSASESSSPPIHGRILTSMSGSSAGPRPSWVTVISCSTSWKGTPLCTRGGGSFRGCSWEP